MNFKKINWYDKFSICICLACFIFVIVLVLLDIIYPCRVFITFNIYNELLSELSILLVCVPGVNKVFWLVIRQK